MSDLRDIHDVPWECPAHGEAQLFSAGPGLYCEICHELAIKDTEIKRLQATIEQRENQILELISENINKNKEIDSP